MFRPCATACDDVDTVAPVQTAILTATDINIVVSYALRQRCARTTTRMRQEKIAMLTAKSNGYICSSYNDVVLLLLTFRGLATNMVSPGAQSIRPASCYHNK